jgi:alpha-1,2-mannosyltransferase
MSYVWWALAVIVVAGVTVTAAVVPTRSTPRERTPVAAA